MRRRIGLVLTVILVVALLASVKAWVSQELAAVSISQEIRADEMTPLGLKLIYEGRMPREIGSVQGFAITRQYYVIAMRPPGDEAEGGETNNRLVLINRDTLADESARFAETMTAYELGHANGMTYNPKTNEILVVGIRANSIHCDGIAHIRASDFAVTSVESLPSGTASGIACMEQGYILRSGSTIRRMSERFQTVSEMALFESGLEVQDIAYRNGHVYMADWASWTRWPALWRLRLRPDQNVIYKMRLTDGKVEAFLVKCTRRELESLCFAGQDCYLLMNGLGKDNRKFYIYRVARDAAFDALMA